MKIGIDFSERDLTDFSRRRLLTSPHFQRRLAAADAVRTEGEVLVNVRRGDYYTPQFRGRFGIDVRSYVERALALHRQYGPINGVRFVSDDVAWCREHLTDLVPGVPVEYGSAGESMFDDLAAVAAAPRLVLANSTFSYWGGFIASVLDPGAQIIGPAEHERGHDQNTPTWFPRAWKRLPVDWLDDPESPAIVG